MLQERTCRRLSLLISQWHQEPLHPAGSKQHQSARAQLREKGASKAVTGGEGMRRGQADRAAELRLFKTVVWT